MIKRNLYIVLAGIITAGAVLGWSQENVQVSEPVSGDAPKVAPGEPGKSYHEAVLSLLNANDLVVGAELQVLATDDEVQQDVESLAKIRLVSPQVGPNLAEEKAAPKQKSSALDKMKSDQTLKDARTLAIVDLAKKSVIEATDKANVDLAGVTDGTSGTKYLAKDGKLMLAAWSCMDDSRETCLYSMLEAKSVMADNIRCDAANQSFVMCGDQAVDSFALFDASECTPIEASAAIKAALASKNGDSGEIEAGGRKWSFVRAKLNSGCDLTSIASMAEGAVAAPKSAVVSAKPQKKFTIKAWGMAIGAGLIMILLGAACTRRKEPEIQTETKQALKENAEKQPEKLSDGDEKLKASLAAEKEEKAQILKKLEQAEALSKEHAGKLGQLKEELEASKSAFKKEEIARLSLEEEKRRLEDALASKAASNTVVDSPVHFAKGPSSSNIPLAKGASNSNIPLQKPNSGNEAETNRVTAPVDEHNLAVLRSSEQSHSFFDSLTDDGWDEIADSFDALFTPKKDASDNSSDVNGSKVNLGDSVLNLINDTQSVMNSPKWNVPSEKPKESPTSNLNIPSEGMRGSTVKMAGLARPATKTDAPVKVQPIPSVKSSSKGADNVKAMPSYTMKGVAFTNTTDTAKPQKQTQKQNSVDDNSLYEALKRRARDVSEIDMPANGDPKQSGAFEFNRGLSKSGVFSVTGSRVDIDPLSETEYFKSLYDKYIQTQKECGEVADKFTLEQFVSRLAREKERLIKTYKCKNVRFSVYVKDGKASLKATPQK